MSSLQRLAVLMKDHLNQLDENRSLDSLTVMSSPVEGRGLFATKDLFPGDLIYVDHALISGPRISEDLKVGCVNCYASEGALYPCSGGCGLLLCSDDCQNDPSHVKECNLINSWTRRADDIDSFRFSRNIVPLRSLLLGNTEKEFLKSLAVHDSPQHGMEVRFVKEHFDISEEQEKLMMHACKVLDANAYEMFKTTKRKSSANLRGLFPISALLNHSCTPNTRSSFDSNGKMYMRATSYIPEGSEIFTTYTGLLWGTPARRHHLKRTKHFSCDCRRCCDKTEFGTKLSALKCLNRSCPGTVLPDEPLNFSSSWICQLCSLQVPSDQVGTLQSAIARLVGSVALDNPESIYSFISDHLLKFLPDTNHIVVELKCRIVWSLGDIDGYKWNELNANWLQRAEELCREILNTCVNLKLEAAPLAARLLLRLHRCLLEKLRRLRKADGEDLQHTKLTNLEKEVISSVTKSYEILNGDVSAPKDLAIRYSLANKSIEELLEYEDNIFNETITN